MKNKPLILAAVAVVFAIIFVFTSANKNTVSTSKALESAERAAAIGYAETMVKEQLSYPDTAKFHTFNIKYELDNKYKMITSTVTCKNTLGVETEYPYFAALILKENKDDGYFPIMLMVGEETYYDHSKEIDHDGKIIK